MLRGFGSQEFFLYFDIFKLDPSILYILLVQNNTPNNKPICLLKNPVQVDYWVVAPPRAEYLEKEKDRDRKEKKDSSKQSLKTAFRALHATR